MPRFDRYLLSQLMIVFGFFALVLVLVYWINRAVILFDQLISDGQSAWVFLEFTALSLPGVIRIVLPIAAFASCIYVTNKMSTESELVVVQATGYSPYRLVRPVVYFGLIVVVMMSLLAHYLVPLSFHALNERKAEITANTTARLLKDGEFMTPTEGVTLYIREISAEGEMHDLFLADTRLPDTHTTFTASSAYLVKTEVGPQLVMVDGMAQTYTPEDQKLFTTQFDDFAYDLGDLIQPGNARKLRVRDLSSLELLSQNIDLINETGSSREVFHLVFHQRVAESLLSLAAALLGFACLLSGGFSRFGIWRQIIGAIFLVILVKMLDTASENFLRDAPHLWPLAYVSVLVGIIIAWFFLFVATRPRLFKRPLPKLEAL